MSLTISVSLFRKRLPNGDSETIEPAFVTTRPMATLLAVTPFNPCSDQAVRAVSKAMRDGRMLGSVSGSSGYRRLCIDASFQRPHRTQLTERRTLSAVQADATPWPFARLAAGLLLYTARHKRLLSRSRDRLGPALQSGQTSGDEQGPRKLKASVHQRGRRRSDRCTSHFPNASLGDTASAQSRRQTEGSSTAQRREPAADRVGSSQTVLVTLNSMSIIRSA
jgi:hypothetical protein